MTRYALIQSGVCATVVEQDSAPTVPGEWVDVTGLHVGPGDLWNGSAWSVPAPVTQPRHITRLSFLNRFTDAEAIAIDLASIGATVPAATMRRYWSKVNNAIHIDLDLAETRGGVQALEAAGLLAAGRALQILDGPVQPAERAPS